MRRKQITNVIFTTSSSSLPLQPKKNSGRGAARAEQLRLEEVLESSARQAHRGLSSSTLHTRGRSDNGQGVTGGVHG
ncbi:unnamed protein product [Prunus armeniaca]